MNVEKILRIERTPLLTQMLINQQNSIKFTLRLLLLKGVERWRHLFSYIVSVFSFSKAPLVIIDIKWIFNVYKTERCPHVRYYQCLGFLSDQESIACLWFPSTERKKNDLFVTVKELSMYKVYFFELKVYWV